MNAPIIDPLQGDFPEVIEEYLEHGVMKCIAFNRRGTLLAAGCANGSCVIWDFETRGIAKELCDKECVAAITSVCWSKYGHYLLASATDKSLTLWNVMTGEKVARTTLPQTTLHARLHPGSSKTSVCLACPISSPPIIVNLSTGSMTVLPISVSEPPGPATAVSQSRNKSSDVFTPFAPTAATFNKHGDLIYVGNSKGEILIIDFNSTLVRGVITVPGGSVMKNIVFSRDGQYLLTNSNDRTIRIYENLLPQKDAVKALTVLGENVDSDLEGTEKLKMVGSKCLVLSREFQDSVNRSQWKAPCFSGDGEWVIGALASKGEHKIYIWGKDGILVKILEGPKEALTDLAWHPVNPIVVSVSIAGFVYIWAKDYTENWSAFAPDFKELEENEEYEEREDEFDLMPEIEKVKETDINEDEEVDILGVEMDSAFSASDMSEEELCFLPAIPSPDVIEEEEKCVDSLPKVEDSTQSETPVSEDAAQNGLETNPESSPCEAIENSTVEEVGTNGRLKRKRKPSEKGLELQSELQSELQLEKGKKSLMKKKTSSKLSKKSRIGAHENGTSVMDDDGTQHDC